MKKKEEYIKLSELKSIYKELCDAKNPTIHFELDDMGGMLRQAIFVKDIALNSIIHFLYNKGIQQIDERSRSYGTEIHDNQEGEGMKSRNNELINDFTRYCKEHPQERFWQALRNWSGCGFILADGFDTFFWKGKRA